MYAYRHSFHAGNHADVLKHVIFTQVLRHMTQKDKGYGLIDTHAGAGGYELRAEHAAQAQHTPEYREGIERLYKRKDLPMGVKQYVALVRSFNKTGNPPGHLHYYPGSPDLALQLMREQDRLRLFEMHPSDAKILTHHMQGQDRVQVHRTDGFAALRSQLPWPTKRAVVLMDPSYEIKTDYVKVSTAAREALARMAETVILIWYPLIARLEPSQMVQRLKGIAPRGWLHASLSVSQPLADGFGLLGSGMFVINPPWTLHDELQTALPFLCTALSQHDQSHWVLEHHTV